MMEDIFYSGLHLVFLVRSVFQFGGDGHIVDLAVITHLLLKTTACLFHVLLAHGLAQPAAVAAVIHPRVEKKPVVDLVLPVDGGKRIAPPVTHTHLHLRAAVGIDISLPHTQVFHVRTAIDTHAQTVFVGKSVAQLGIDVIEIIPRP